MNQYDKYKTPIIGNEYLTPLKTQYSVILRFSINYGQHFFFMLKMLKTKIEVVLVRTLYT